VGVERDDPIAVGQLRKSGPGGVPLGLVFAIAQIPPAVLILEPLEPAREARPLPAGAHDLRHMDSLAQLGARGVDQGIREDTLGDGGQHLALDDIGRRPPASAAEG
jgi:hypothetical protein